VFVPSNWRTDPSNFEMSQQVLLLVLLSIHLYSLFQPNPVCAVASTLIDAEAETLPSSSNHRQMITAYQVPAWSARFASRRTCNSHNSLSTNIPCRSEILLGGTSGSTWPQSTTWSSCRTNVESRVAVYSDAWPAPASSECYSSYDGKPSFIANKRNG
jgi:hypothetical protein